MSYITHLHLNIKKHEVGKSVLLSKAFLLTLWNRAYLSLENLYLQASHYSLPLKNWFKVSFFNIYKPIWINVLKDENGFKYIPFYFLGESWVVLFSSVICENWRSSAFKICGSFLGCISNFSYSEASRYTASSCTDLDNARFWIGSKKIWDARIFERHGSSWATLIPLLT